jgi:hypothetical protein
LLTQALEDLRGAIGVLLEHRDNLGLEGIKLAVAWSGFARPETLLAQPEGHGARVDAEGFRNLSRLEPLVVMQVFDVAKLLIIDHPNTSQIW